MIAEFTDARAVQVLLRPHDWNRLNKLLRRQRKKMSPFIRSLVLTELQRQERKEETDGRVSN